MWCSFMWVQYMWCTLCGKIEKEWIWDATLSGIRSASQTRRISFPKVANSGPQGPPVGPPRAGGPESGSFGDPLRVANVADLFCKSGQFGPPGASRGPPPRAGGPECGSFGDPLRVANVADFFCTSCQFGPPGASRGPPPSPGAEKRQGRVCEGA